MKMLNFLDDTENVTGSSENVTGNEANRLQPVQVRNDDFVTTVTTVTGKKEDIYITGVSSDVFPDEDENKKLFSEVSAISLAYLQNTGNSGNTGNIHKSFSEQPVTKAVTQPVTNSIAPIKVIEYDAHSLVPRPPLPRELWQSGIADYGQAWRVWQELRKDYFAAMGKHESGYYINDTIAEGYIE